MRSRWPYSLALLGALLALSAPAAAGSGYENFTSEVRAVDPPVTGLEVEVVGGDETLELRNKSGRTVVVEGYDNEPYLRFRPDGLVERNLRSPATYLNRDRKGLTPVPASAQPRRAPQWQEVSRDGRYRWFDHRIHITAKPSSLPRRFTEATQRKKIFDWQIPLHVNRMSAQAKGTLYWDPDSDSSGGFSAGLLIAIAVAVIALIAAVIVLRSRRRPRGPDRDEKPAREAW